MFETMGLFLALLLTCAPQDAEGVRLILDHFEPHCERCVTASDPYNVSGRLILEGAETVRTVPTFVMFDIFCRRGAGPYHPTVAKDVWISYCYMNFKICSSKLEAHTNYSHQACACRKLHEKVYKIWITQTVPYLYRLCSFRARISEDKGFSVFYPSNDSSRDTMSRAINVAALFKTILYDDKLDRFYADKNKGDSLNVEALRDRFSGQGFYVADTILVFTAMVLTLVIVRGM